MEMILPVLACLFAVLELFALWKRIHRLEYAAKPAVMICLFTWLYLSTGMQGIAWWFGVGILFSLAGDVLLLFIDRTFIFGLVSFLLAHSAYIAGLRAELQNTSFWSLMVAFILGISALRIMHRIVSAVREKGQTRLIGPVVLYSIIITVMLYAAMLTLSNPAWKAGASVLVAAGAFLFYLSDITLAWHRFVAPISNGRLLNVGCYHAGQIMLIAGVVAQFA
jgi:alkenylglycerophosphocholine/alkenylglycerophosphoethanolamine hydrolase